MGCYEVRGKFNDYIEGIVLAEEKSLLDDHFKSCEECRNALAGLEKTVGLLRDLDKKEPPPWLTQKVMSRVKSQAGPGSGLLKKLFYPLNVKLPIEAFGIILIAVSAFYIFKTMEPEIKLAQAPLEKPPGQQATQGEFSKREKLGLSDSGKMLSGQGKGPHSLTEKRAVQEDSMGPPVISNEASFADKQIKSPETPAPINARNSEIPSSVPPLFDKHKEKGPSSAQEAMPSAIKKEAAFILTVIVENTDTALNEIASIVSDQGGRIIRKAYSREKTTVTVSLKQNKIRAFYDRLTETGKVQESKELLATAGINAEVSIDILLVKSAPE